MFTAALFTIVRTCKQPKCPLTGDKEDVAHIYNEILVIHKKGWNNAKFSNMNGPRVKWVQTGKDKYHMILLICET